MCAAKSKQQKGPSWLEVGLGAALSIVLGAALGALYLLSRPVQKVREIPKDAPAGAVYYIEGTKQVNSASSEETRKAFVQGQSIAVDEGELNAFLIASSKPATGGKSGDKAAAADQLFEVTGLNARIKAGQIQFGDTVTYNIFGFTGDVIVQATGTFSRHGSQFEFDPDTLLIGGCPVQRLPFVRSWAVKKFIFTVAPPDDVAGAWAKLTDVAIEGSLLRLKMQ